ncbi:type II toxin-antitoxin system RelE/ParE family toxin [Thalassomonas viridans]|uniref:Type II toxin-antitoxin system RelE/ParE family toxin n=1 Tax=Thalassomonas viridans TaxID=137584 RepID=A0AAF0CAG2_9GAMM|nr:type II toxin-antitoxin system RelE/ParE family toxin [Thalassomonas viridans]WDE06481.1 type II toxin-antitoxin system RelE/ParE family toxin [Thalassomonas viridans]
MYEVKFSKKAEKAYKKLSENIRVRIDQKISYLQNTPRGSDTKKLAGLVNVYRTRVGRYRLVYEITDSELLVWILDIGHRGSIYQK